MIDGRAPVRKSAQGRPRSAAPRRVNLIIDIQQRMAQGKGPGYERWAKIYNLKQMAAALQFLQENGLTDYDALAERTTEAVDRAHALAGELRGVEERLASTTKLTGAVVEYLFYIHKGIRVSRPHIHFLQCVKIHLGQIKTHR